MTFDQNALVVRYRPGAHEDFAAKIRPAMRFQAIATIVLGAFWGVMGFGLLLVILIVESVPATFKMIASLVALAVPPILLIVMGVRRLRFKPTLPEVVLTITDDEVIISGIERLTMLGRSQRGRRWDRRLTEAEFVRGGGKLTHDRIRFTSHDGRKLRTEYQAVEYLDTPVEDILAAVRRS